MGQTPIEIPVTLGIGDIKKQLKDIKGQIASAFDPDEIARLGQKAGELKDNLARVNEQVEIYSSGSAFEQSANALGLVGTQLANLDFEGAAESAVLLQKRIASITPADVEKQIKGLQDTFTTLGKVSGTAITGLLKNIGGLSKAFVSFGLSLLANPIFLIAAAIVAIVGVIVLLLNKLGLLKPIMEAIGKVFEYVKGVINSVVDAFGQLTDWLELTDIAAEKSAAAQTAAAEKKADAYEKASKRIIATLDENIKIGEIEGKNTTDLEIAKQEQIKNTAYTREEALKAKYAENKLTDELSDEEVAKLKESLQSQRDAVRASVSEIKIIKAKDTAEQRKNAEDQKKADIADAKEARDRALQYAKDRQAAVRLIRDLELENLEAGTEKELAINKEKYVRLIEDTKNNEKLKASEKAKVVGQLQLQEQATNDTIIDNEQKERVAKNEANQKELEDNLKIASDKRVELGKREILAEAELKATKNADDLSATLDVLELKRQAELNSVDLTLSERALIEEKYRQEKEAAEQVSAEKQREIQKATTSAEKQLFTESLTAFQDVSDLVFLIRKNKAAAGSAEELRAAKTSFNVNKALQISTIGMSTIQAVMSALAQPLIPFPLKIAESVAVGAAGLANAGKIAATKFEGGATPAPAPPGQASSGVGSSPGSTSMASPVTSLFGSANNLNNLNEKKSAETTGQNNSSIVVQAVVVADQVSAQQALTNSIVRNSSL